LSFTGKLQPIGDRTKRKQKHNILMLDMEILRRTNESPVRLGASLERLESCNNIIGNINSSLQVR